MTVTDTVYTHTHRPRVCGPLPPHKTLQRAAVKNKGSKQETQKVKEEGSTEGTYLQETGSGMLDFLLSVEKSP